MLNYYSQSEGATIILVKAFNSVMRGDERQEESSGRAGGTRARGLGHREGDDVFPRGA